MSGRLMLQAISIGAAGMLLAGCAGDPALIDDTTRMQETLGTDVAGDISPDADAITADLTPLEGSGVTGSVQIVPAGDSTRVTVSLRGATAGVHQGHIHGGTCTTRGGALIPLTPITTSADGTGESTATIAMPVATLRNGNHIVVYHTAGGSPGASVTCAEIPALGT